MSLLRKVRSVFGAEQFTLASGNRIWFEELELVVKPGLMAHFTKVSGKEARPMESVASSTPTVISIKVSGEMTRLMVKANTSTSTEQSTKDSGKMTSNMDMVLKHGLMKPVTRVSTSREQNMAMVFSTGMTEPAMRANSDTMISLERVATRGVMDATTMENGKATRCTVKESSGGTMAVYTKEALSRTASMDSVCLRGKMVESTKAHGFWVNKTVLVSLQHQLAKDSGASGRKVSSFSSLKIQKGQYPRMIPLNCSFKTDAVLKSSLLLNNKRQF